MNVQKGEHWKKAVLDCTWRIPASTLGRHAAVRADDRVRSPADNVPNRVKSREANDPSPNPTGLRARVKDNMVRLHKEPYAPSPRTDLRGLRGRRPLP